MLKKWPEVSSPLSKLRGTGVYVGVAHRVHDGEALAVAAESIDVSDVLSHVLFGGVV